MLRRNRAAGGAALLLVALALTLGACKSKEERVGEHLQRAESFNRNGQHAEAIIEFKNALELAPHQGRIHFELAKTYWSAGRYKNFFWELQEAARLEPRDLEVKLYYARALSRSADRDTLESAATLANEVSALEPENWEARLVQGSALTGLGRLEDAKQVLEAAVEMAPDQGEPLRQLAEVHRRLEEYRDAEKRLRDATRVDPGFVSHATLGLLLGALGGRDAEAEAAYRAGIEHSQTDRRIQARGALVNFLIARQRLDDAEKELQRALEAEGRDELELVVFLARLHAYRGEPRKADAVLIDAADARPDDPQPYLLLSTHRSRRGDLEGALAAADRALAVDPTDSRSRLHKAYLLVEAGARFEDAERMAQGRKLLDAVIESDPGQVAEGLLVKGRLDLAEDRVAEAIPSLRRAIDLRSGGGRAHFLLGAALFRQGNLLGARAELARALELEPDRVGTQILLTRVHSGLGESALALELGQRALISTPNDKDLRIAMAQSLIDEGRGKEARDMLDAIPEDARDAPTFFATGRVYEMLGDDDAAWQRYQAAAERDPYEPAVLGAMLEMDVRRRRLGESAERIRSAAGKRPGDPGLARLEAHVARLSGDPDAAAKSLRRAILLDSENLELYFELAGLLKETGKPGEAVLIYEKASRIDPDNGPLHLTIGTMHEQAGRKDAAIASYEEAVRSDPSLSVAKNNLAFLLAEAGRDLERALELAREAKEELPDRPDVADTLGYVLLKKEIPSAAIGYLREAERGLTPQSPLMGIVRHHLALAYEANGDPDEAIQALRRALRDVDKTRPGADGAEPQWASEAREMLERLQGA